MKNTKPVTVKFKNRVCTVDFEEYENGRTAISLNLKSSGEPFIVATVNVPDAHLEENEVIIKDYSENEGILDVLQKAGIISKPVRQVPTGWMLSPVCELRYSPQHQNQSLNQNQMITRNNYFSMVREHNILTRFPDARDYHDFIVNETNNGADWTPYEEEKETREVIDSYFGKLNEKLKSGPGKSNSTAPAQQNRNEDRQSQGKNQKRGPGKRKEKSQAPARKKKQPRKAASGGGKSKKKQSKVLNLPKGKLVELVDPHLLFVGRYLRMNNQKRTRNALEKFFSQINQAADARVLRKASPYAGHILYIQKQLLKFLSGSQEEVSVEIPAAKFDELLRAVAKEQQMASVRLLKRYHNIAGRTTSIDKATKLYNEMYNAIEKGKIPEKDRLFKRVAKVMRDLSDYVKAEDISAELVRLPAELGGVLGFMDGCLCTKDRELNRSDAPQDVSCSFRGK